MDAEAAGGGAAGYDVIVKDHDAMIWRLPAAGSPYLVEPPTPARMRIFRLTDSGAPFTLIDCGSISPRPEPDSRLRARPSKADRGMFIPHRSSPTPAHARYLNLLRGRRTHEGSGASSTAAIGRLKHAVNRSFFRGCVFRKRSRYRALRKEGE